MRSSLHPSHKNRRWKNVSFPEQPDFLRMFLFRFVNQKSKWRVKKFLLFHLTACRWNVLQKIRKVSCYLAFVSALRLANAVIGDIHSLIETRSTCFFQRIQNIQEKPSKIGVKFQEIQQVLLGFIAR